MTEAMFDIVEGWSSVQLQDDETGYRFWTVMPDDEVDSFISEHRELGYSLDDLDRAHQYGVACVMSTAEWMANPRELTALWEAHVAALKAIQRERDIASLRQQIEEGTDPLNAAIKLHILLREAGQL